jgi:hypothetical protein
VFTVDIETDDIEAEVRDLKALGCKAVAHVKRVVMEAPTGQLFCVVRPTSRLCRIGRFLGPRQTSE